MEFSALAAKETSALLTRVLGTASQASLSRVDALRAALDTAAKALEAQIASSPNVEREIEELVKRLTKAAAAEADARLKHLSAEARKITDALRAELAEAGSEREGLTAALQDARTQVESMRTDLQAEQKNAQAIKKELAEAQAAHKTIEAARADAVAAREKEAAAKTALESEIQSLRGQLDSARKETKLAAADADAAAAERRKMEVALNAATSQAQAAEAKLTAVTTLFKTSAARVQALEREQEQHAAALRELEARVHEPVHVETVVHETHSDSVLDGLLGAFEALSTATTIGDVLATLGEQLAAEFPRVALFRVKGNRLEGAHQIGFDLTNDIGKVVMPLAMDSLLTRAVTSGHTERLSGDVDTSGLPFGGSPTFALAMPIVVDGDAIAIVYADDFSEGRGEPRGEDEINVKFAEALRQHTVALLLRLTSELKAMAELRAYAVSLLGEIEQMYESDVSSGKQGDELKKSLHSNLEYARSIYANRAQFESPAAGALLDVQLAVMIDSHSSRPFGQDLAAVAEWASAAMPRAAEAS